jgi:branched-chain amino acid aminotransferase
MSFIYLNGDIVPEADAKIPVTDRSYLFGEGLFESFRSYDGEFPLLSGHLNRLEWSATFLNLPYPAEIDFSGTCRSLLAKNGLKDARFKIILSRNDDAGSQTNVMISCRALETTPPHYKLKTVKSYVNDAPPLAAMKTTSCLVKMLARAEARESGCDDAVLLNSAGFVTEASTGNLFWIDEKGVLKTVPEAQGLLHGIVRTGLLNLLKGKGIVWREEAILPEELSSMREVFLTNSVVGIKPVVQIDGRKISGGETGSVTQMLIELWEKRLKEL